MLQTSPGPSDASESEQKNFSDFLQSMSKKRLEMSVVR